MRSKISEGKAVFHARSTRQKIKHEQQWWFLLSSLQASDVTFAPSVLERISPVDPDALRL